MIAAYLVDIIVLLAAAVIVVPFFQAIGLGAVPGFLIAGIVVGPWGLGLINNVNEISHIAEIGVVLLLFVIGIELKPSRLWLMRRLVFGLGTLQIVVVGAVFSAVAYFLFEVPFAAALLIGPALALSSTAFVLQILTEQKLLTSGYGRTSFSILLMQDLAVVPLLALIPLLSIPDMHFGGDIGLALGESILIVALVVIIGRYFLHPVLHRVALSRNPEVFTASTVLIVLGTALATEHAGLSMAMGAFLAGLLISDSFYRHQVIAEIHPFRGLLLGLFFMSMGMSLNLNLLLDSPLFSLAMLVLLVGVKTLVLYPAARLFGLTKQTSLAVALVLGQSGEFALVIFSLAFQSQLLSEELFQQLLLMVLLSMMATPALAQLARRLVASQGVERPEHSEAPVEAPIVLAGFGRVGRRIGEILTRSGKAYVALDSDPLLVQQERANGYSVFYGDVRQPEVMNSVGASHAQVIIVTINDPHATEDIISSLRKTCPGIHIFARGHRLSQCRELRRLGAAGVVSENIEASLELARMVLKDVGYDEAQLETLLSDFRRSYHAQINDVLQLKDTQQRL